MPPVTALRALGTTAQQWAGSEELERLRVYVEELSRQQGQPPDTPELSQRGYEALPECLPPAR
jgi:hypothetical protein